MRAAQRYIVLIISVLLGACSSLPHNLDAPELSISKIALTDVSLLQQEWEITLRAYNPNAKKLTVKQLNYELHINGHRFAQGSTNQTVVLAANQSGEFTTRVSTSLINTLRQLRQLNLTPGTPVPYRIKGSTKVGMFPLTLPFDKKGEVPLPSW